MPDLSGTAYPARDPMAVHRCWLRLRRRQSWIRPQGSALSVARVREMDGREFGTTKRLGFEGSWGKFENLLGRSFASFKSDTNRLYVQWKPAEEERAAAAGGVRGTVPRSRTAAGGRRDRGVRAGVGDAPRCVGRSALRTGGWEGAAGWSRGGTASAWATDHGGWSAALDGLLQTERVERRPGSRLLPQSENADRHSIREDPPGGRAAVQAERVVGGVLLPETSQPR